MHSPVVLLLVVMAGLATVLFACSLGQRCPVWLVILTAAPVSLWQWSLVIVYGAAVGAQCRCLLLSLYRYLSSYSTR